jgi:transposase
VPALPPYIIEPIWQQFAALLPEREVNHPLGCHRSRIPDRVVFEKLVQVLVFGCAYRRIADEECSATTLRDRRDEWIACGVMETLRRIALEAYDRAIGLELADVAVDGCITKAPCGGEKAGKSPVDRGKQGIKRSTAVDGRGIPIGAVADPANRHDSPLLAPTLEHASESVGGAAPGGGERASGSRLRLERHPRVSKGPWAERRDRREGEAGGPAGGHEALGGGAHEFLAQRPQKAGVVYREARAGHRLLDRLLGRDHHREEADPRRLEPLPLGKPTSPPTMTYPRSL